MFGLNAVTPIQPAGEGATRKILSQNENQMMVEVAFAKGAVGAEHRHPHQQISYIAKGSFEARIEGEICLLQAGDSMAVPAGALHGVTALEEGSVIVDVFTPIREDFLK